MVRNLIVEINFGISDLFLYLGDFFFFSLLTYSLNELMIMHQSLKFNLERGTWCEIWSYLGEQALYV